MPTLRVGIKTGPLYTNRPNSKAGGRPMLLRAFGSALMAWALVSLTGCGRQSDAGVTRLVDRFKQGMVKGSAARRSAPGTAALWSFADSAPGNSSEKAPL